MRDLALDGSSRSHALGGGYHIAIPSVVGTLRTSDGRGEKSRGFFEEPVDRQLEDAGLKRDKVIHIAPTVLPERGARGLVDRPPISLDVPRTTDTGALVLMEDANGALTWHFPVPRKGSRAVTAITHFEIPLHVMETEPAARAFGLPSIGGAIIKVFTYPLGLVVKGFVRKWEAKNRPYLVRAYTPDNYMDQRKDFPSLPNQGWRALTKGRALLFVHGTFSSAGAFSGLPTAVMNALSAQYGGRMFAFNHFTMSDDPTDNAKKFFDMMPDGITLDVDIICHSRGGEVSRALVAEGASRGFTVGKIVFVAATNAGTTLADKEHFQDLFNRLTTIAKVVPGSAGLVLDAVAVALQVPAKLLLGDLKGLAAMDPDGEYLAALNAPGGIATEAYAIASNFEPKKGTPLFSLTRAEDVSIDAIFGQVANDLVVPRDGVFKGVGAAGFPIADDRVVLFGDLGGDKGNEGVIHTEFFSQARTHEALLKWLVADAAIPAARTLASVSRRLPTVSVADMEALRPHIVNLSEGRFQPSGKYSTSAADVDDIFAVHIPAWMKTVKPLRIVFYAHGGLTNEQDGLDIARKHVEWWKANGVYPIYFVWETGLFDAVRAILERTARQLAGAGTRDFFDFTDKVIEKGVRAIGGPKIWQSMKNNAALCSDTEGGATYVAQRLKEFCAVNPVTELHAVGHSAGAIFHSFFLPTAVGLGVPGFASLQLLAPAIQIDAFVDRLVPIIGDGLAVRSARMFAMTDDYERDDNCISIYRKSLLYLIHHALERGSDEPILGLETCVLDDPDVRKFFTPANGGPASAIWSVTPDSAPPGAASQSTSHGGFDDDAFTMSSVAAHVLSSDRARISYPGSRGLRTDWPVAREWMRGLDRGAQTASTDDLAETVPASPSTSLPSARVVANERGTVGAPAVIGSRGRRTALCVGIDAYSGGHQLKGCVGDATAWSDALAALGFDVRLMRDGEATMEGIIEGMRKLVSDARSGDVLAFQFAGHGYELPDLDGDEGGGPDQALVPFDFDTGGFVLDDDIYRVFSAIKPDISLTVFLDNCNSGTGTRLFRNVPDKAVAKIIETGRARFLKTDRDERDALEQAHAAARSLRRKERVVARGGVIGPDNLRWVNFSACLKTEEALEHDERGDFSVRAIDVLTSHRGPLSNAGYQKAVEDRFGMHRAQTPFLDCRNDDKAASFLAGILAP